MTQGKPLTKTLKMAANLSSNFDIIPRTVHVSVKNANIDFGMIMIIKSNLKVSKLVHFQVNQHVR